jgi:hypothetical protein
MPSPWPSHHELYKLLFAPLKCVKISYEMLDSDLMLVPLSSYFSVQKPTNLGPKHYNVIKEFYDHCDFICFY